MEPTGISAKVKHSGAREAPLETVPTCTKGIVCTPLRAALPALTDCTGQERTQ